MDHLVLQQQTEMVNDPDKVIGGEEQAVNAQCQAA